MQKRDSWVTLGYRNLSYVERSSPVYLLCFSCGTLLFSESFDKWYQTSTRPLSTSQHEIQRFKLLVLLFMVLGVEPRVLRSKGLLGPRLTVAPHPDSPGPGPRRLASPKFVALGLALVVEFEEQWCFLCPAQSYSWKEQTYSFPSSIRQPGQPPRPQVSLQEEHTVALERATALEANGKGEVDPELYFV